MMHGMTREEANLTDKLILKLSHDRTFQDDTWEKINKIEKYDFRLQLARKRLYKVSADKIEKLAEKYNITI